MYVREHTERNTQMRLVDAVKILTICGLSTGCVVQRQSYAPDGRVAYTWNCSGRAMGWDNCLQAAGNICKTGGYDVIDRA